MKLDGIAEYLADKDLGIVGKSIFMDEMPSNCEFGTLLRAEYYGTQIDHYLPGYRNTEFRVAVRSREFVKGQTLAYQVMDALTFKLEQDIGKMHVKQMLPNNEPRSYRKSKGGYWEWEIDVSIVYTLEP